MIALVDIDNVLNNFGQTVVNAYNNEYNTLFRLCDMVNYDMFSCMQPNNLTYEKFCDKYFTGNLYCDEAVPLPDSIQGLCELNSLCETYLVTSREMGELPNIMKWLYSNYPFIKDEQLIRCKNKNLINGDILIDDCLDNILNFSRGRIVFDYPWNRNIDDKTNFIHRAYNWEDILNIIKLKLN